MNHIIATGLLKNKSQVNGHQVSKYIIKYLDEKHLPMVMDLQKTIIDSLHRPDLLQPFSRDFMKKHLGRQGAILGVFTRNRLVAFRNLYYPDPWDEEWNLGRDLGLKEEELTKVANLQMVCVHPDFRGNKLASTMNWITLELLREKSMHHHICATVSPYNIWNLPILLSCGFQIVKLKNKYGGKLRYVVYQNLRTPARFDNSEAIHVHQDALDTQKKLLDLNYCGVAVNRIKNMRAENRKPHFELVFKPRLAQESKSCNAINPFLLDMFHAFATQAPIMAGTF